MTLADDGYFSHIDPEARPHRQMFWRTRRISILGLAEVMDIANYHAPLCGCRRYMLVLVEEGVHEMSSDHEARVGLMPANPDYLAKCLLYRSSCLFSVSLDSCCLCGASISPF